MIWLVAIALALPGLSALCISMKKHQRQTLGAPLTDIRATIYRRAGFGLVSAMVIWCMALQGWSVGLVTACGVLTVTAVIVILTLTLRPNLVRYYFWMPEGSIKIR